MVRHGCQRQRQVWRACLKSLMMCALVWGMAVGLGACATKAPKPVFGKLEVEFQGGQTALINLDEKTADYALNGAIAQLAAQGYYNGNIVYRQVPGYFVLLGKARLSGQPTLPGVYGVGLGANGKVRQLPEAGEWQVGAVVHANGEVGPELLLQYGWSVVDAATELKNVRIGTLQAVEGKLLNVRRGDKVVAIRLLP